MRFPRFGQSLLARTVLALAAVGLLPVLIASYRLVDLNRDALAEQVLRTHVVAARTSAARVTAYLAARRSLAAGAANNPAMNDPKSPAAAAFLAQTLEAWSDLDVLGTAVVNAAGEEVIRAQLRDEGVAARVSRAIAAKAGPVPEGDVSSQVVADGSSLLVRLAVPLPSARGEVVVVGDASGLADLLHPEELGEQAELVLIDAHGERLAGSQVAAGGIPAALRAAALSGRVSSAARYRRDDGSEVLGASATVDGARWAVISLQPTSVADALAANMRRRAVAAIGAAALLIVLLSLAAWVGVVRPIARLAAAQSRLAGRSSANEAAVSIGSLEESFAALERSLRDRRAVDAISLGRYQVRDVIGSGAMGTVFSGYDPKLERPVALKIVRASGSESKDKQQIERLLREAVTVARFSHPHIVAVHDVQDAAGGAFVAMELIEGCSLESLVDGRGPLPPERVAPLGAAVASALAAAHQRGLVHRDVKPPNVLLGRDGAIKVTDFGIAALVSAGANQGDLIFGTPGFLPPETLLEGGWTASGDLFALGATLYFALTGELPFDGESLQDILRATVQGPLPLPPRSVSRPSQELEAIVLGLLERDPLKRPASADRVADQLNELARAQGWVWAAPAPGTESLRSTVRQGQWLQTGSLRR